MKKKFSLEKKVSSKQKEGKKIVETEKRPKGSIIFMLP